MVVMTPLYSSIAALAATSLALMAALRSSM
jgi:hypothetical protein